VEGVECRSRGFATCAAMSQYHAQQGNCSGEATCGYLGGVDGDKLGGDALEIIGQENRLVGVVGQGFAAGLDNLPVLDPVFGAELVELPHVLVDEGLAAQLELRGRGHSAGNLRTSAHPAVAVHRTQQLSHYVP